MRGAPSGAARLGIAVVAASGFATTVAQAEEQVVVTGTRTPERIQQATVKTDVVTREEAERRGATNVADALATQPGLVVNPGNYGFLGGVSALQIQGFDRDRVLILEDGERVVGDVGGAIDLSNIPIGDVERIEVVSGPASSLYGSAALGGVVNVITAPPKLYGPSGRGRAEYRSLHGVVLQGNVAYKSPASLSALRGWLRDPWAEVDANYTRADGIEKTPGLPDLRIPETDHRMLGLRTGAKLNDAMDVRVRARIFRDRQDGIESTLAPGLGRFVTDLPTQTDRYTLHVIHVTKLGGGKSLRLTMGRQQFDNFTANDRRDSPIDERHDRRQRMQSVEAVATIPTGTLTTVAGTRFEAEHFEQDITKTESTATGPQTSTTPEVTPLAYGTAAFYAQTTWAIRDDLKVMPGFRTEVHTRYGASFTPRLAAAWQPSPRFTLRASAGRGYRAPSAKELGFVFDHSVYGYRIKGNGDLQPEKSWGVNADVTVLPGPTPESMSFRGSVYANWVEDLIDLDLGHGAFDGPIATYTYTNFGKARTAGAQLDARFKPAKWISADTSYAYTWTRDDVNEQPLPGRPPHALTTAIRLEPGWKLEFVARARVTTSAFLDENSRSPGYQTVDLRAGRTLWPHSQGYVGALDLFDVKQDPNRLGDTRPPLGRVLYVGLRADFPWDEP